MSYTRFDFPTKKALKTAVAMLNAATLPSGERPSEDLKKQLRRNLTIKPTSIVHDDPVNGDGFLEGPQYPKAHTWYAKVRVEDGVVVHVYS